MHFFHVLLFTFSLFLVIQLWALKLGKTQSQALEILQHEYGDHTMSRTRVSEWHKKFKEARDEMKVDSRSERPSKSRTEFNVKWVRLVVCGDCRLTFSIVARQMHLKNNSLEDYPRRFRHIWKVTLLGVLRIRQFLVQRNITVLKQLSYSSDLALCDFFFSPNSMGLVLKVWRLSRWL